MKDKLNLQMLRMEIRTMSYHSPVYKVLKDELIKLGYWRNKQRGNPGKAFVCGIGKHQVQHRHY